MKSVSQVQVLGAGVDAMPTAAELHDPHGAWLDYADLLREEYDQDADADILAIVELLEQRNYEGAMKFVNDALADSSETGWDAVIAIGPDPMDFVQRWVVWVRYVEPGL